MNGRFITMWILSALVSCLLAILVGCSCGSKRATVADLRRAAMQIQPETPRAMVISILGEPDDTYEAKGVEFLTYGGPDDPRGMLVVDVTIDDTVARWAYTKGEDVLLSEVVWMQQKGKKIPKGLPGSDGLEQTPGGN